MKKENTSNDSYPEDLEATTMEELSFAFQRLFVVFTFPAKMINGKSLKQTFFELTDQQTFLKAHRQAQKKLPKQSPQ